MLQNLITISNKNRCDLHGTNLISILCLVITIALNLNNSVYN